MATKVKGTNARRSSEVESYLESRGVNYDFLSGVTAGRFDMERSLRNQARLGVPLNEDVVKRYTEAVLAGDQFPPVLASEGKDGQLVILDGNHRLKAHSEAGEPLDVYVCSADPQVLVLVTFEANAKHGLPSSEDERLSHALFLIDNGVSQAEAATRLGVPTATLRKAYHQQTATRRADDVGVLRRDWESIHPSARKRLMSISTDEGFKAAAKLTRDAGLRTDEVGEIVARLNETRSAQRQVAIVEAMGSQFADRVGQTAASGSTAAPGRRPTSTGPRGRLAMALGQLTALPSAQVVAESVPEGLRDDLVKKIDEAAGLLYAIRDQIAGGDEASGQQ